MNRLRLIPRKIYLLLLALVLVLGIIGYKEVWHKSSELPKLDAKYVSFSGGYLFTIPDKYTVDETLIPGVAIAYPEASPPSAGQNLEGLYASGIVAVQPITALKDNNALAFQDYVSNTLAAGLRKSLNSTSDIRETKQGGVKATQVFAQTPDGKRLRAVYAVNFTQPVMIVAGDESDQLKIVGSTMEDLKKTKYKPDIDQAANTTKTILTLAKSKDASAILKQGTKDFKKALSKDKLAQTLQSLESYFDSTVAIVGGTYNGQGFIAQVIFGPSTKHDKSSIGTVQLHKEGISWKLQAIQLPK